MTAFHTELPPEAFIALDKALYHLKDVTGNYSYLDLSVQQGRDSKRGGYYIGLKVGDITFWTAGVHATVSPAPEGTDWVELSDVQLTSPEAWAKPK